MSEEKIKYLKHPVSPEKKKELMAQGFKILDARYKPAKEDETKKDKKEAKADK